MNFDKKIEFSPAFDKRHSDPSKNYGIHGADMRWYLMGPEGAVQFVVYTSWHLPHVQAEMDLKPLSEGCTRYMHHKPLPADIGYHSKVPQYEGQESIDDDCEFTGGKCYYDGSGLNAKKGFELLVEKGSDAVWEWMEECYSDWLTPAEKGRG